MFWKFLGKFIGLTFAYAFPIGIAALILLHFWKWSWIPLLILLIFISALTTIKQMIKDYEEGMKNLSKYEENLRTSYKNKYDEEIKQYLFHVHGLELGYKQAVEEKDMWKKSFVEKNRGYPALLDAINKLVEIQDQKNIDYLQYKKHPSKMGAEVVKEETTRRRIAEYECRKAKLITEYYESIAPFLIDLKNDIIETEDDEKYREYTEEERHDPITYFLSKEEYRKLSSEEKNQKALDRYWARPKSNWLIGRIYERYIGYLYEKEGYDVEYHGIFKGYEDLGRDLICTKDNELILIQCKYWSQFKTIYEKHIFQFFGTYFQYKDCHKQNNVKAIFYTSTQLSDIAKRFANELGILLKENYKFDKSYPSIKCNISRVDGTKIYHLPFDQQYDNVKIEKDRGEFYCSTVKEAEDNGFRRAYKWKGVKEKES